MIGRSSINLIRQIKDLPCPDAPRSRPEQLNKFLTDLQRGYSVRKTPVRKSEDLVCTRVDLRRIVVFTSDGQPDGEITGEEPSRQRRCGVRTMRI